MFIVAMGNVFEAIVGEMMEEVGGNLGSDQ
jgi:hypothetical protein